MDPLNPYTQALLNFAGLLAGILSYHDYKVEVEKAVCKADEGPGGCKLVYMLPEALLFGRIHLSELAPVFFMLQLLIYALFQALTSNILLYIYSVLWIAASITVPYLIYLEVAKAKAICVWCTIMHAVIVIQALLMLSILI
ncbi:MAG: hypothetical protein GSR85_12015 [Desulfurococcales archaeon]|nr:hypothetical protein [Desulfurococcales archaeon]